MRISIGKDRKQQIEKYVGKGNGEIVGRRYRCFMEGLFDFIDTSALWKGVRFTSERHLRYIVGGQKKR